MWFLLSTCHSFRKKRFLIAFTRAVIDMSTTANAFLRPTSFEGSHLVKKKSISLDSNASSSDVQDNLTKFLDWQVTATKSCGDANMIYKMCRRYNQGSGTYCGEELTSLYECLKQG
jgi:hypothetical protein